MTPIYEKHRHLYTIGNFFRHIGEPGSKFVSEPFTFATTERSDWYFWLYPNGQTVESKGYLSIIFKSLNYGGSNKNAKFRFSIIKNNREEKNFSESVVIASSNSVNYWKILNFIRVDYLLNPSNGLLINGNLELSFEIFFINHINIIIKNHLDTLLGIDKTLPTPNNYLGQTLQRQQSTDCIIVVGKYNFYVHKQKLINRSPVFDVMFKHELKESIIGIIEILDFEVDVVKEMLDYIYTNEAPNIKEMATEVFLIADKYEIEGLKSMAMEYLLFNPLQINYGNSLFSSFFF
uniref:BTB domain-containing protein n=1 Tax=Strongyloides venezuelensis TaxID=75913 RepID=A0A0K0EYE0_STRVS